jgi:hypothetical protein
VTTTFQGTLAGTAGQSGTFAVSIETGISASAFRRTVGPQSAASASGNLTIFGGGGTFALTGTFDTSASTLNLSGGGFVLTGAIRQDALSGSYIGPNNRTGEFAGLDATHNAVTHLCGSGVVLAGVGTGSVSTWNVQVSASGAASGETSGPADGGATMLTGQLNGMVLTLLASNGITATGVVQNGSVSGTFGNPSASGTFTGSTDGCR